MCLNCDTEKGEDTKMGNWGWETGESDRMENFLWIETVAQPLFSSHCIAIISFLRIRERPIENLLSSSRIRISLKSNLSEREKCEKQKSIKFNRSKIFNEIYFVAFESIVSWSSLSYS